MGRLLWWRSGIGSGCCRRQTMALFPTPIPVSPTWPGDGDPGQHAASCFCRRVSFVPLYDLNLDGTIQNDYQSGRGWSIFVQLIHCDIISPSGWCHVLQIGAAALCVAESHVKLSFLQFQYLYIQTFSNTVAHIYWFSEFNQGRLTSTTHHPAAWRSAWNMKWTFLSEICHIIED